MTTKELKELPLGSVVKNYDGVCYILMANVGDTVIAAAYKQVLTPSQWTLVSKPNYEPKIPERMAYTP